MAGHEWDRVVNDLSEWSGVHLLCTSGNLTGGSACIPYWLYTRTTGSVRFPDKSTSGATMEDHENSKWERYIALCGAFYYCPSLLVYNLTNQLSQAYKNIHVRIKLSKYAMSKRNDSPGWFSTAIPMKLSRVHNCHHPILSKG